MQIKRVALWGNVGCGKDTWAAVLPIAVEQVGLQLRPFDAATVAWQAATRARLIAGDFPQATDIPRSATDLKLLNFVLAPRRPGFFSSRENIVIQVPQAAGGWWTAPEVQRKLHEDTPDPYQYLALAAGIICLLDPTTLDVETVTASLMTTLEYLDLYRRRLKRRQSLRIALWLTKMDIAQHRTHKSSEEAYGRVLFGSSLAAFLKRYRNFGEYEFRWGGCSAVGMVLNGGRLRSNTYWDYTALDYSGMPLPVQRILEPRSLQPDNVLEPVRWVLEPVTRSLL
jgi:hypothetical protein